MDCNKPEMTNTDASLPEVYCANHCNWVGIEEDLEQDEDGNEAHCPKCDSNYFILEISEDWENIECDRLIVQRWRQREGIAA